VELDVVFSGIDDAALWNAEAYSYLSISDPGYSA